jgi:hypothetical protein
LCVFRYYFTILTLHDRTSGLLALWRTPSSAGSSSTPRKKWNLSSLQKLTRPTFDDRNVCVLFQDSFLSFHQIVTKVIILKPGVDRNLTNTETFVNSEKVNHWMCQHKAGPGSKAAISRTTEWMPMKRFYCSVNLSRQSISTLQRTRIFSEFWFHQPTNNMLHFWMAIKISLFPRPSEHDGQDFLFVSSEDTHDMIQLVLVFETLSHKEKQWVHLEHSMI